MFQLQFGMPKLRKRDESVSVAQSNTVLSLVLGALRCFYCPFKVHCSADNDNATKATKSCCKKLKICWAHSVNLHTAGNRTKSNTCFGLSSVLYMVATVVASAPLCAWDITPPYFWSWVIYNVQFLWKIILPFVDLKSCKMCSLHEMLDLFISLKTDPYRDIYQNNIFWGIFLDPPVSIVYTVQY